MFIRNRAPSLSLGEGRFMIRELGWFTAKADERLELEVSALSDKGLPIALGLVSYDLWPTLP